MDQTTLGIELSRQHACKIYNGGKLDYIQHKHILRKMTMGQVALPKILKTQARGLSP